MTVPDPFDPTETLVLISAVAKFIAEGNWDASYDLLESLDRSTLDSVIEFVPDILRAMAEGVVHEATLLVKRSIDLPKMLRLDSGSKVDTASTLCHAMVRLHAAEVTLRVPDALPDDPPSEFLTEVFSRLALKVSAYENEPDN